jgi:hypothetical protein
VWVCPTCGTENPLDASTCSSCGTSFGKLFVEPAARRPLPPPGRAATLSLAFPGLGHATAGRVAEGLARAIVFAYMVGTGLAILILGGGSGILLPLTVMSLLAAVGLYGVTAIDAYRLASGDDQILSTRTLLYAGVGMMLLTLVVLAISGFGVAGR